MTLRTESLKRRLLVPTLLLAAAASAMGIWLIYLDTYRHFTVALEARAGLVAAMISNAASRAGELQNTVAAIGAEPDVLEIVVVGGQPARVLASTHQLWLNKPLEALPGAEVGDDLREAMRTHTVHTHFNAAEHLFDLSAPLRSGPDDSPAQGAVMVHLDTRTMNAAIQAEAQKLCGALLLAMCFFGIFAYRRLDQVVLRPIAAISARVIKHHEGGVDETWAQSTVNDELGQLARTVHETLLRMDAATRDLENQKFALDQHSLVAVTDAHGKITYANDRFCALSRYSRQELIGKDHRIVSSGYHPKAFIAELWSTIKSGRVWHGELRNRAKDGSIYWVDSSIIPLMGKDGRPEQFIAIRTDITERKQTEAALLVAKGAAETASLAKSEFLANMSHEIRTPMNGVIGLTALLLETELTPHQRELLETVRRSGEALLIVINDVLDYSKIEAGKLELELRPFDTRNMVESVMDLMAPQASEKKLDLIFDVRADVPQTFVGDATRLRQVLLNFVSNALKFTAVGNVLVSVEYNSLTDDTGELWMSVSDTGIGIPNSKLDQLFSSFTQVDASTTRRFGGSGLGLAICRRLADLMEGRVWVESEPDLGSTFYFVCPLRVGAPTQAQSSQPGVLRGQRLLLVDDNQRSRETLEQLLRAEDAEVKAVSSGAQALSFLKGDRNFGALILDHDMPGMSGPELAATIRRTYADSAPALILVSALSTDQRNAVQGAFAAVLAKPIKPRALVSALEQALGLRQSRPKVVRPRAAAPIRIPHYPLKVLLVEDNPVNQRVAMLTLERMGYRAHLASHGKAAVEAARATDYDLILMDVHMPEMDGLEATHRIRQLQQSSHSSHRPWIVAVTASAMDSERIATAQAGMDDFASKPMRMEDLERVVTRAAQALGKAPVNDPLGSKAAHPAPESDEPVIRIEALIDSVSGDVELAQSVVDEFLRQVSSQMDELANAVASNDCGRIRAAAHRHKGSLATLHAGPARRVASAIESAGQTQDLERARAQLALLQQRSVELVMWLERWRAAG